MKHHDASFFLDDKEPLACHIDKGTFYIPVKVNNEPYGPSYLPGVTFYIPLEDEQTLVNFKNSVLWAYESYQRSKHATNNP